MENEQQFAGTWGERGGGAFRGKGNSRYEVQRHKRFLWAWGPTNSSALLEAGLKIGGRKGLSSQ